MLTPPPPPPTWVQQVLPISGEESGWLPPPSPPPPPDAGTATLLTSGKEPSSPPPPPKHTPYLSAAGTAGSAGRQGRSQWWRRTLGTCWRWWPGPQWTALPPQAQRTPQTCPPPQSDAGAARETEWHHKLAHHPNLTQVLRGRQNAIFTNLPTTPILATQWCHLYMLATSDVSTASPQTCLPF